MFSGPRGQIVTMFIGNILVLVFMGSVIIVKIVKPHLKGMEIINQVKHRAPR